MEICFFRKEWSWFEIVRIINKDDLVGYGYLDWELGWRWKVRIGIELEKSLKKCGYFYRENMSKGIAVGMCLVSIRD